MEIIISVVTSTAIVAVLVFVFKESFKSKLEVIKREIEIIRANQSKDLDFTREAITAIWSCFARLDDNLRYDFPIEIASGNISPESIRPFLLEIRTKMVLLPEELYEACDLALFNLRESWNTSSNKILQLTKGYHSDRSQHDANLVKANDALDELKKSVEQQLIDLRKLFREYITKQIQKS